MNPEQKRPRGYKGGHRYLDRRWRDAIAADVRTIRDAIVDAARRRDRRHTAQAATGRARAGRATTAVVVALGLVLSALIGSMWSTPNAGAAAAFQLAQVAP